MSNKIVSVATAALEITKMVLVIAANTTCKMLSVGKSEIAKQYSEYQKKATPQQLAAIKMFQDMTSKGSHLAQSAKSELKSAKGKIEGAKSKAEKKVDKPSEKPKK